MINEATDRIMAAITALVEEVRGETRAGRAVRPAHSRACREIGNPNEERDGRGKTA